MIESRMPDSSVRLSLKYNGPAVDDGSMPLTEVVAALQGFSGAYGKVANSIAPESTHELRVTAVRQSSFEIHILAWLASSQAITALHDLERIGSAAGVVFGVVKGYIKLKKFLKGDRYEITIGDGNTKLVINRDGESQEVPQEVIDLLQSKTIDDDLKKIVAPLDEGIVDSTEIAATDDGGSTEKISVTSEEKSYFGESSVETTVEVTFTGKLISNNKETLRGTFERIDGTRFPYHYSGQNPDQFQSIYAYRGSVRVIGVATVTSDLIPKRINITDATRLQGELNLQSSSSPTSSSSDQT